MPFNEDQKRVLLTNLARDKAENLRAELARVAAEAREKAKTRTDLSEEDKAMGEQALQKAMESIQRMVAALEGALEIAEGMAAESGDDQIDRPSEEGIDEDPPPNLN